MPEAQPILVYGNPVDGFYFVGPFEDRDAATRYMESEWSKKDVWLAELNPPDGDEPSE